MSEIEVRSIRKVFDSGSGEIVAVDDVEFTIEDQEFFTLVGPSGCGKTTTLRCIAGLESPTEGRILFDGSDVTDVPANKRNLAMMFQNIALYPHMTAYENIAYPLKVDGVPRDGWDEPVKRAAAKMQISDLLEKYPGDISGGQRQRTALARTIVQDPVAFLMDESLSDLDAKLKWEIRKVIQELHEELQTTTVYVTHDQEQAMTMSDQIAVMNEGKIEQIGTPEEVYNHPVSKFVADFIGTPSMNFEEGRLDAISEDTCSIELGGETIEFDIDYAKRETSATTVTVGFRPEALDLVEDEGDADIQGEVLLVERIGDRKLAYVDGPTAEIRTTFDEDRNLEKGSTVSFSINQRKLYVFDSNGDIVVKGATSPKSTITN